MTCLHGFLFGFVDGRQVIMQTIEQSVLELRRTQQIYIDIFFKCIAVPHLG